MTLAPGTVLGSYEIVALLGTGGMGQVYRARRQFLGDEVAIKVMQASADRLGASADGRRLVATASVLSVLPSFSVLP